MTAPGYGAILTVFVSEENYVSPLGGTIAQVGKTSVAKGYYLAMSQIEGNGKTKNTITQLSKDVSGLVWEDIQLS